MGRRGSYHARGDLASTPLVVVDACPDCGAPLDLRRRKADGAPFIGCAAWPGCRFTISFDEREQRLAQRIVVLEEQIVDLERELELARNERDEVAETLSKRLRSLVARFHPDRNPAGIAAHEVTVELNLLRAEVSTC